MAYLFSFNLLHLDFKSGNYILLSNSIKKWASAVHLEHLTPIYYLLSQRW